eukprot:752422-Hanusia_phi.AAC.6
MSHRVDKLRKRWKQSLSNRESKEVMSEETFASSWSMLWEDVEGNVAQIIKQHIEFHEKEIGIVRDEVINVCRACLQDKDAALESIAGEIFWRALGST